MNPYAIFVAIFCVTHAHAASLAPNSCEIYNITGGFKSTGPPKGEFLQAFTNQVKDAKECFQECCNYNSANAIDPDRGCRASWFYKDHDSNDQSFTVCQLWYCEQCDSEIMVYDPRYESQIGILVDDRSISNTQDDPNMYPPMPNMPTGAISSNDQGYVQYPEGSPVQSETGFVDQNGVQDPVSVNQQGQWVYNPATGEYTFQAPSQPPQVDPYQSNALPTSSDLQELPTGYISPSEANQEGLLLDSMNSEMFNSSFGEADNENGTFNFSLSGNVTDEWMDFNSTTPSTDFDKEDNDWWNWWPFGGDGEDGDENEEDEEEWEEEWEKEEEEAEKEWEQEEEKWEEEMDGYTTLSYEESSKYVTDSVENQDKDEDWFQNMIESDGETEKIYSTSSPKEASMDDPYRPETFGDPEHDDIGWQTDYVNAPVIAVGACAAVVLVLLLLVVLGRKLTGKNDRAQYKPLKESFSGSSTYHEDI